MSDRAWLKALRRPGTLVWSLLAVGVVVISLIEISSTTRPFGFSLAAAITNGLQFGGVYALVALGVAIVYRSTKVINFAQGELGTIPAFAVLMVLMPTAGVCLGGESGCGILDREIDGALVNKGTFVLAVIGAVIIGAVLAMVINLLIVQRLAEASPVTSLVATAGLTLLLGAAELIWMQAKVRTFPRLIEGAPPGFKLGRLCFAQLSDGQCQTDQSFAVAGEVVPWNTVLIFILLAAASIALAIFFRSQAGVALLATAQEPFAAELYGVSSRVMSTLAWGFAGAFGALAGVLGAGVFTSIRPAFMTSSFLVPGLVAAVLGGITSMPGAVVGGLTIGVAASLANSIFLRLEWSVPNPPQLAIFIALLLVLLFRPRGLLGKDA